MDIPAPPGLPAQSTALDPCNGNLNTKRKKNLLSTLNRAILAGPRTEASSAPFAGPLLRALDVRKVHISSGLQFSFFPSRKDVLGRWIVGGGIQTPRGNVSWRRKRSGLWLNSILPPPKLHCIASLKRPGAREEGDFAILFRVVSVWRKRMADFLFHARQKSFRGLEDNDEEKLVMQATNRGVSADFVNAFFEYMCTQQGVDENVTTRQIVHGDGAWNSSHVDRGVKKCIRSIMAEHKNFGSFVDFVRADKRMQAQIGGTSEKQKLWFLGKQRKAIGLRKIEGDSRKIVFISHAWDMEFRQVVESINSHRDCEEHLFWLDIFAINQHRFDKNASLSRREIEIAAFEVSTMPRVIEKCTGGVHLLFMPLNKPLTLDRAWCWQEIASAVHFEREIRLSLDKSGQKCVKMDVQDIGEKALNSPQAPLKHDTAMEMKMFQVLKNINCEMAVCSTEIDNRRIHRVLQALGGNGYTYVNNLVKRKLAELILLIADKEAETKHSGLHLGLTERLILFFNDDDLMRARLYRKIAHQFRVAGGPGDKYAKISLGLFRQVVGRLDEGTKDDFKFQQQLEIARVILIRVEIQMRSARTSRSETMRVRGYLRRAALALRKAKAMYNPFGALGPGERVSCAEVEAQILYWEARCLYLYHSESRGDLGEYYAKDLEVAKAAIEKSIDIFDNDCVEPHFFRGAACAVLGGMVGRGQTSPENSKYLELTKKNFRDLYGEAFEYWKKHFPGEAEVRNYEYSLTYYLVEDGHHDEAIVKLLEIEGPTLQATKTVQIHRMQYVDLCISLMQCYLATGRRNEVEALIKKLSQYILDLTKPDFRNRPRIFFKGGLVKRQERFKEILEESEMSGLDRASEEFDEAVQEALTNGTPQELINRLPEGVPQQDVDFSLAEESPYDDSEYLSKAQLREELENDVLNPPLPLWPLFE